MGTGNRKQLHEIDRAGEEYFMKLAFGPGRQSPRPCIFSTYLQRWRWTPLQPTVLSSSIVLDESPMTGASPETVAPLLFP